MKNVLITGGGRGIGRACVELFSKAGWRVFFTYVSDDKSANETSESFKAIPIKCDVSCVDQLYKIDREIAKYEGSFDCIVNNAGIAQQKLFTDITEQEWDNVFNVNVKGMFFTTQHFVKPMIAKGKGSIINISSVWGLEGGSCEVHYASSKAAVIGFTRALANELGLSGIRVNCIAPGVIDTDMNGHLTQEDMDDLKDQTPLNMIGTPEQVAKSVLFLADDDSFITGQVIKVSGGF